MTGRERTWRLRLWHACVFVYAVAVIAMCTLFAVWYLAQYP